MIEINKPDKDSYYSLEDETPFFALGRNDYWFNVEDSLPELDLDADELIGIFQLEGRELPDHFLAKEGEKVSKLVLTFGRYGSDPFEVSYEVGFFDGEMFRGLDGYRIYPDPTHWVHLPKPPRAI